MTLPKVGPSLEPNAYKRRLKLLREIVSGGNQREFADRLGIPVTRRNNFERGHPVSREVAFILMKEFPDVSVEWLWFGMTGNLSASFAEKVKEAERLEHERKLAHASLKRAQKRVKRIDASRESKISPR